MEEQEKIDIREHLIGWIDTLLKDGIVPKVVNPEAIKANYVPKSKIKEKIEELEKTRKEISEKNNYTLLKDNPDTPIYDLYGYFIVVLQELMEDK